MNALPIRIATPELDEQARDAFRQSVDKRRFMTSRFVRRGASYGEAIRAAHTLFPLVPWPPREPTDEELVAIICKLTDPTPIQEPNQ